MPLQLKINNFYFGELHMFLDNITIMPIHSNDKELFRKCREIWNNVTELVGINNPTNTSAIRDKYRNDLAFVFTSVFNNFPQTSLLQYRY